MLFNIHILIVDDEQKLRSLFKRIISLEGYIVFEAQDVKSAKKLLQKERVDIVICDVRLPDGNGIDFVKFLKYQYPVIEMILFTAYGNITDGIQAMKNGAFDYLVKGNDNDKIIPLLNKAVEKIQLQQKLTRLEKEVKVAFGFDNIIGKSPLIKRTKSLAQKAAPLDVPVLLLGETGTGKELFAKAIHSASPRANSAFVAINCSAFSKDLLESELFGHKAGAFTGAVKDKTGLLEEANGGTLFLDEIGEMDIELQAKLLRVLEVSEFIKVGDTKSSTVNIRIISATNKNLFEEVLCGKFREDLFYRLNVFSIQIPSLLERKVDISLLAGYYVNIFSKKMNKNISAMSSGFIEKLLGHIWRGNIRELKNVIERAVIMCDDPCLTEHFLPPDFLTAKGGCLTETPYDLQTVEKKHILKILNATGGNKQEAARLLKIGIATLYRKMGNYGLHVN
jgi:Response regulator containing CheY-like receiver, AAA-type ATPase, and DNA-binding domains